MTDVEIVHVLKKILGKFEKVIGIKVFGGDNKVICISNNNCITIYNPQTNLTWDANGFLTEVRITGIDSSGQTRTFKKTLTWSPEGYLQSVSNWTEA